MDDSTLAHPAHVDEATRARWQAIRERSTRGLLAYNRGDVLYLLGDKWAVRSSRSGHYLVDLEDETCTCDDFIHFGHDRDINCKHIIACAVAHGTRRGSSARQPHCCNGGWVVIGHVDDDGVERHTSYRCRRCAAERG